MRAGAIISSSCRQEKEQVYFPKCQTCSLKQGMTGRSTRVVSRTWTFQNNSWNKSQFSDKTDERRFWWWIFTVYDLYYAKMDAHGLGFFPNSSWQTALRAVCVEKAKSNLNFRLFRSYNWQIRTISWIFFFSSAKWISNHSTARVAPLTKNIVTTMAPWAWTCGEPVETIHPGPSRKIKWRRRRGRKLWAPNEPPGTSGIPSAKSLPFSHRV